MWIQRWKKRASTGHCVVRAWCYNTCFRKQGKCRCKSPRIVTTVDNWTRRQDTQDAQPSEATGVAITVRRGGTSTRFVRGDGACTAENVESSVIRNSGVHWGITESRSQDSASEWKRTVGLWRLSNWRKSAEQQQRRRKRRYVRRPV